MKIINKCKDNTIGFKTNNFTDDENKLIEDINNSLNLY